jgi:MFS family permease
LAAIGLFLFPIAGQNTVMFFIAATLLFVGVCFWWPTMLGIASERTPKTGALGMAIIGGAGSFATAAAGPALGYLNGAYSPAKSLQIWAILPVVLFVVFGLVYLSDKSKGGYKPEVLDTGAGEAAAE